MTGGWEGKRRPGVLVERKDYVAALWNVEGKDMRDGEGRTQAWMEWETPETGTYGKG